MFEDLRTYEEGASLACDLCIVGSGAAGLTLAHELRDSGLDILVLEAGGFELEPEIQDAYVGRNVGLPYFDLDTCRLRYYGGTTNHWAGFCLPFRPYEYAPRPWIPWSGWPFGPEEMAPWIRRTAEFLGFAADAWNVAGWAERLGYRPWPLDPRRFENAVHVIRPVRMGPVLRDELAQAERVRVLLHADVLEILANERADHVTGLAVATPDGRRFRIRAGTVVLATGGIENARILLLSRSVQPEGLGNAHGLVGRFFAEHPVMKVAEILPVDPSVDAWFYDDHWLEDGGRVSPFVILAPEAWEELQVGPVTFDLRPIPIESYDAPGMYALRRLRGRFARWDFDGVSDDLLAIITDLGSVLDYAYETAWAWQQPIGRIDVYAATVPVPHPESRVLLGEERDALGRPRVVLDWRLTPFDRRTIARGAELLGAEVGRLGLGRLRLTFEEEGESWPEDMEGANHHVGTTRMATDPRQGVVDPDGRVHGIDNLYIAGSSIFPFPGIGTPTFMIIALAMRLADHLRRRLAP